MLTQKRDKIQTNDISFVRGQIKKLQKLDNLTPAVQRKLMSLYSHMGEHQAIQESRTEWDHI
jgi:hypothetical protein